MSPIETATCAIGRSGPAPCQCSSPAAAETVSPVPMRRAGAPRACTKPSPSRTCSTWPPACRCQWLRVPASKRTTLTRTGWGSSVTCRGWDLAGPVRWASSIGSPRRASGRVVIFTPSIVEGAPPAPPGSERRPEGPGGAAPVRRRTGQVARDPYDAGMPVIGVSQRRLEGGGKVTGATRFTADLRLPGLAHARLVLSPLPSARIARVDLEAARAAPGVLAAAGGADLPDLAL